MTRPDLDSTEMLADYAAVTQEVSRHFGSACFTAAGFGARLRELAARCPRCGGQLNVDAVPAKNGRGFTSGRWWCLYDCDVPT